MGGDEQRADQQRRKRQTEDVKPLARNSNAGCATMITWPVRR
jgi:hypothetical protein